MHERKLVSEATDSLAVTVFTHQWLGHTLDYSIITGYSDSSSKPVGELSVNDNGSYNALTWKKATHSPKHKGTDN